MYVMYAGDSDSSGQLTHINLAADLIVGNEGCASRTKHAHYGHTPCDNCKWDDHAVRKTPPPPAPLLRSRSIVQ
jgi:hypothetical protein